MIHGLDADQTIKPIIYHHLSSSIIIYHHLIILSETITHLFRSFRVMGPCDAGEALERWAQLPKHRPGEAAQCRPPGRGWGLGISPFFIQGWAGKTHIIYVYIYYIYIIYIVYHMIKVGNPSLNFSDDC